MKKILICIDGKVCGVITPPDWMAENYSEEFLRKIFTLHNANLFVDLRHKRHIVTLMTYNDQNSEKKKAFLKENASEEITAAVA